ncbi:MAG: hypothetical protein HKN40_11435 [Winogradskyella sp.]|uniref:dioxygenase family protein n=1 Tax=Winogradskyella sp. TaxID=1883156 RepID=UPI0017BA614B|nr:hypothetical protein [Winogradskyella sp.]
MKKIAVLFFCLLFTHCASDSSIDTLSKNENNELAKFQNFNNTNKLIITDNSEPGEELLLCLTFIDKASKKTLSNQRISFYHTSTEGDYEPSVPNDETTARLNGTTVTNRSGEVYVKTILPGDYGNSKNNRHIHTTVYDAAPVAYDIFFKQYSGGMGSLMNSGNDQIFYADLKKTANNKLVCFLTIEVKNPQLN